VGHEQLDDLPESLAAFDWKLHHTLTLLCGNPIYTLMLNGFAGFYEEMARLYFETAEARAVSRAFYADLLAAARRGDAEQAGAIVEAVMKQSIALWQEVSS
jgi:GntR family negative regulator for fad regulon and positive regulator of fabA